MKMGRWYEIRIQTPDNLRITITPPTTCVLEVSRDMRAAVNNANITLYNLAPDTRNLIFKDLYTFQLRWQMSIVAGYENTDLYEIFRGNIEEAYSVKQNTEWVTTIKAYDGSFQIHNGFVNETVESGTEKVDILKRVIHTMPEMLEGVLGTPAKKEASARGTVLVGNSYDVIQGLTDNTAFIDGETIYVLGENEVIAGEAFVLDSDLNFTTPKRRDAYLEVDTLFSPEIRIGRIAEIRSKEPKYNGQYQVYGLKHAVTFSEAISGNAVSTVSLNAGARTFSEVL